MLSQQCSFTLIPEILTYFKVAQSRQGTYWTERDLPPRKPRSAATVQRSSVGLLKRSRRWPLALKLFALPGNCGSFFQVARI